MKNLLLRFPVSLLVLMLFGCGLPSLEIQGVLTNVASLIAPHTVGGTVKGLLGSGLILSLNGGDFISIKSDGAFSFSTPLMRGASYTVQVSQQPAGPSQACLLSANTGVVLAEDVTSVTVSCMVDVIPPSLSLDNLHNNSLVETGFAIGTAADDVVLSSVEVSLDGGPFLPATGAISWKYALPVGSGAWREGSLHTIKARSRDLAGNYSPVATATVRKGPNRDVNGDGYPDVIAGAKVYNSGQGRVFIYRSSAGGLPSGGASTVAAVIITGNAGSYFGQSVALGDINGDGYADAVVGASGSSTGTGWTYIFYSNGSGGITATDASGASVTITGENNDDSFGRAVAVGDLTGDGYADLVVSASRFGIQTGRIYVFHSSSSGITASTASAANGIVTGETAADRFGNSMALGDMNGDGYLDVAVSAYGYLLSRGRVYVFHSSSGGLSVSSAASADSIITGENAADYFGSAVSADYINNDGFADLLVGAYGYAASTGRAYVFHSSGSGIPVALASAASSIITGENSGDMFGIELSTGDVNGDGHADAIVGANAFSAGNHAGKAYVFHSSAVGLSASLPAGSAVCMIVGATSGDNLGNVIAISDINGDGYADALIASIGFNAYTGLLEFYSSSAAGVSSVASASIQGDGASMWFGSSLK